MPSLFAHCAFDVDSVWSPTILSPYFDLIFLDSLSKVCFSIFSNVYEVGGGVLFRTFMFRQIVSNCCVTDCYDIRGSLSCTEGSVRKPLVLTAQPVGTGLGAGNRVPG